MNSVGRMILFLCLVGLGLSCSSMDEPGLPLAESTFEINGTRDSVVVAYGKGVEFTVSGKKYTLYFRDVKDGRCPANLCYVCYGSLSTVSVTIASGNKEEKVDLLIVGCASNDLNFSVIDNRDHAVRLKAFKIGLSRLTPYPMDDKTDIAKNSYVAKILAQPL